MSADSLMARCGSFALGLLAITQPALAQSAGSGIELLSSRQISVDQANRPHVESYIAVDPGDPLHLIATAMVVVDGRARSYPYASFDGGRTWSRGQIVGDSSIIGAGSGDPVVYITNTG